MNYHYNPKLKLRARELRNNPTNAERIIWNELLKNKMLHGYRFLRQRPMESYIVDFFCKELSLIIEIDGFTHEDPSIEKKDQVRQHRLEELGYQVLRFTDYEVFNELYEIRMKISAWIETKAR